MRNGALDANNYFNNLSGLKRPNSHRNQFGVAVGGPVYIPGVYKQTNKTFFFFNFEGHRDHNAGQLSGTSPLPAFRTGDFSAVLGSQAATCGSKSNQPCFDVLGRLILNGALYDPYTTRHVTSGQVDSVTGLTATSTGSVRERIAGNSVTNATNGINSIGQKLVNYYPAALTSALSNNWSASGLQADYSNEYSVRIDHNFSDRTRLYGRFSRKP